MDERRGRQWHRPGWADRPEPALMRQNYAAVLDLARRGDTLLKS
jgi:hypothetical protein